jgi:hypothetical protein
MNRIMPSSLPSFDRMLLHAVERIVPAAEREEWSRAWQAELWYVHHRRRHRGRHRFAIMTDLAVGLTRDALWLRTESWRITLSGTASLCLASLAASSAACTLIALAFSGGWEPLGVYLREPMARCLLAAALILFVSLATSSRRHVEQTTRSQGVFRCKRLLFFAVKTAQVFALAFLLSMVVCFPLHPLLPNTADLFQMFAYVLFAVIGMRWALQDQEQRCKQCLQCLAQPARVGRPSHNLLEWNGTELSCKLGHGLLSVPEMETSWCQSSHWVDVGHSWDETMSA